MNQLLISLNRDILRIIEDEIKYLENQSSIVTARNDRNLGEQFSVKPIAKEMMAKIIKPSKTRCTN